MSSRARSGSRRACGRPSRRAAVESGGLSRREVEVVQLIAKGWSNPRIAERLFISDHTVHRHVANILVKLDVRSRSAIVARAAALGLLGEWVK